MTPKTNVAYRTVKIDGLDIFYHEITEQLPD